MTNLIPFNRDSKGLMKTGFEDFYNMLDDFFSDSRISSRNLLKDTFKLDIHENDEEYCIEAELPGIKKDEIDLKIENETLHIAVNRDEETNREGKNYIHRERRTSSMSRRVRLINANLDDIKAKLDNGVLTITVAKDKEVTNLKKIEIED